MTNEKLIVALLLIAIVFSVLTLVVSVTSDVIPSPEAGATEDVGTASVVLEIIPKSSLRGGA